MSIPWVDAEFEFEFEFQKAPKEQVWRRPIWWFGRPDQIAKTEDHPPAPEIGISKSPPLPELCELHCLLSTNSLSVYNIQCQYTMTFYAIAKTIAHSDCDFGATRYLISIIFNNKKKQRGPN